MTNQWLDVPIGLCSLVESTCLNPIYVCPGSFQTNGTFGFSQARENEQVKGGKEGLNNEGHMINLPSGKGFPNFIWDAHAEN